MKKLKNIFRIVHKPSQAPLDIHHASHLLSQAESSLGKYLIAIGYEDNSSLPLGRTKFGVLKQLYQSLRQFDFDYKNPDFPLEGLPTARDLFWDDPTSELEEACLNDALSLSFYLQDPDHNKGELDA